MIRLVGAANDTGPMRRAARDDPLKAPQRYARLPAMVLTRDQTDIFRLLNPAALWIAGNLDGPQPTRFGDNEGAWPVLMGVTQDRRQKSFPDAYHARGTLLRYWCEADSGDAAKSWSAAERLHVAVYRDLQPYFETALHDFLSFDSGVRLGHLDRAVRAAAVALEIDIKTDRELVQHITVLDRASRAPREERTALPAGAPQEAGERP